MTVTPQRRPPLKTDDVRRLITGLAREFDTRQLQAVDGFKEVCAAIGHVLPKLPEQVIEQVCAQCRKPTVTLYKDGPFCSQACEDAAWEAAAPAMAEREQPEAVRKALAASPIINQDAEPAPPLQPDKAATCKHEVWLIRKGTTDFYCPDCGTQRKDPI